MVCNKNERQEGFSTYCKFKQNVVNDVLVSSSATANVLRGDSFMKEIALRNDLQQVRNRSL